MKRPPLSAVNVPQQEPGAFIGSIASWCASAARALRELTARQAEHAATIHQLSEGHNVACGTVTLTVNVATTVVSAEGIPATAVPIFSARSANAATEIGNGTIYVSAVAKGSFTLTHANAATTARTFSWWCPVPG